MASNDPATMYNDWQESHKAAFEEAEKLAELFTHMANLFRNSNPTLLQLLELKKAYNNLELPLIDNYPHLIDNTFVNTWLL